MPVSMNVTRSSEPLVGILHIAYAFVPLGFALLALGILPPDLFATSGALHAWTAGAVGVMTLSVMTRASLGHTGQPLIATRPIQAIDAATIVAALARIVGAFGYARTPMLHLSATGSSRGASLSTPAAAPVAAANAPRRTWREI